MKELSDAEIKARIRNGRRASGLLTGVSVILFAVPIVFLAGVVLFVNYSMSLMD